MLNSESSRDRAGGSGGDAGSGGAIFDTTGLVLVNDTIVNNAAGAGGVAAQGGAGLVHGVPGLGGSNGSGGGID
jgi:hypothetical protein